MTVLPSSGMAQQAYRCLESLIASDAGPVLAALAASPELPHALIPHLLAARHRTPVLAPLLQRTDLADADCVRVVAHAGAFQFRDAIVQRRTWPPEALRVMVEVLATARPTSEVGVTLTRIARHPNTPVPTLLALAQHRLVAVRDAARSTVARGQHRERGPWTATDLETALTSADATLRELVLRVLVPGCGTPVVPSADPSRAPASPSPAASA